MRKEVFLCVISAILFFSPSFLWAGTATVRWQANSETDLKEYRVYEGTASRTYGTPVSVGKATSYIFTNLTEGLTHYFAVTAVDTSDNESGFSAEVSKFIPVSDAQSPQVAITSPATGGNYTTSASSIDLRGTATDNVGVTQVSWSRSGGGSGTATGTSNWSIAGIGLSAGQNTITVTAKDAAGNQGTSVITVTYSPPSSGDTQPPQVAITSPTAGENYATSSSSVDLRGTATDNVGVTQVSWSKTGGGSGTATGTSNWSVAGISLSAGPNTITVTAKDAAGNQGTATITMTYTAPSSTASSSTDSQAPQVTITYPTTSSNYTASRSRISLRGSASDNVGVTQVIWSSSNGGSGTAYGTSSWSIRRIRLASGDNTITVTAKDAAGNQSKAFITVTYGQSSTGDTQSPQVTISSPTSSGNYTTSTSSINLGGAASDNVGVTQVTWSSSGGGSGTAIGTSSWSIAGIGLTADQNTITVTAKDAAGNQGTAVISVNYTSSSSADTQAPQVAITSPTTDGSYTSSSSRIDLAGNASDDVGVTQVTWSSTGGGSGTASGTSNWSIPGIRLASGDNTITVTAEDAAGNKSTATIVVANNARRSWWNWWRR